MACFNPLDRGNLNQIKPNLIPKGVIHGMFQSPRSGKFESNIRKSNQASQKEVGVFQSPRSGKFESNIYLERWNGKIGRAGFNPLDRGNLNQM